MYGVFRENPFHFKHNGLKSLIITLGNETIIHLDFCVCKWSICGNLQHTHTNTILVFDLTARGECNSEQFTVRKLENVRINLKYSHALTETNNLILCREFSGDLQTDANINAITNYL